MTDFRALCAELLGIFEKYDDESNLGGIIWDMKMDGNDLLERARAALAQPEPQGPTDEELLGYMLKAAASVPGGQCTGILDWDKEAIAAARAVIAADRARRGRPAIEPVPVSERLPGPEDCDAVERCWCFNPVTSAGGIFWWSFEPLDYAEDATHWLPHWALPVPKQEAEP
jgi:hypothetical protein